MEMETCHLIFIRIVFSFVRFSFKKTKSMAFSSSILILIQNWFKEKSSIFVFLNDFGPIIDFGEYRHRSWTINAKLKEKQTERERGKHKNHSIRFFIHLIWVKGQLVLGELILTIEREAKAEKSFVTFDQRQTKTWCGGFNCCWRNKKKGMKKWNSVEKGGCL